MQADGAVDLARHDDLLRGNHIVWRGGDHQRASAVGQVCMRGEEGFDPARSGHTETADFDPPTSAPGHPKREVGQCLDAGLAEHRGDPWLEPRVDTESPISGTGTQATRN